MKVLRAGAIYVVANALSAGVPFLLLPILTRALGPDEYGQVVSFALLVTLCLSLSGLNAHAALGVIWFREPKQELKHYVGAALTLALSSTVVIAGCVGAVIWIWPELGGGLSPLWGAAAGLTAGCNVILQCRLTLWQSEQKALHSASLQFASSVLNVGLSLGAVFLLGLAASGRNGGFALSSVLLAAVALCLFQTGRQVSWSFRREHVKMLLVFGMPLIFHVLGGALLGTADRWTISIQLGRDSLGVYGAGAQLGMTMAILADAFVKAYGPWMYEKLASTSPADKHQAVGAVYIMMPTFLVVAIALWALLRVASPLILGARFQDAVPLLPWFMLGGAFTGVYLCTSVMYFFAGRTGLLSSITLSSALIGAAFTWMLVARYGVTGAAVGYALTQILLALLVSAVAVRVFDLPWSEGRKAMSVWFSQALGSAARQAT